MSTNAADPRRRWFLPGDATEDAVYNRRVLPELTIWNIRRIDAFPGIRLLDQNES